MSLDMDGYTVLRAIGSSPNLFPAIALEAKKAAKALVVKQLRATTADIDVLRAIYQALGPDSFALLVDAMTDPEAKSFVNKFDKFHPDQKEATPAWRRKHLMALGSGAVEASKKPARKTAAKKPAARKPRRKKADPSAAMISKAMAATRKRDS